jgi:predicted dehydrogenase
MTAPASPIRVGIVGTGWRAEVFAQLALALPDEFELVGVVSRRLESAERAARSWGVTAYPTPGELVRAQRPGFVVSAVPWDANPDIVRELVGAGTAVLSETPPAPDIDGLRQLWAAVGAADRVQVAEQYLALPGHAARRAVVAAGTIGTSTSVHVSSTHGYHAVAMMRGFLGAQGERVGSRPVTVSARTFTAPLVDPLNRSGWTDDDEPKPATTTLATIDFGDGRSGLYDFTDNQWHNQLRFRRILIRGSLGEISGDEVIRLAEPRAVVQSTIRRYQVGHDLNLDGHDTEHLSFDGRVVYRNPFLGRRWMDDEIAMASMLTGTAAWLRGDGPAPYPLAEGCQDHLISLAIDESAATGQPVTTTVEPWSTG